MSSRLTWFIAPFAPTAPVGLTVAGTAPDPSFSLTLRRRWFIRGLSGTSAKGIGLSIPFSDAHKVARSSSTHPRSVSFSWWRSLLSSASATRALMISKAMSLADTERAPSARTNTRGR